MTQIPKNMTPPEILKSNIENTKMQRKAIEESAKAINNPQLAKYLESTNNAMKQAEDFDRLVLSKISGTAKPVEKGIVSKLKGLIKGFL